MADVTNTKKRVRDGDDSFDSKFNCNSPEAKRFHHDLFEILDDSEQLAEDTQDLNSVMKSFEEEILQQKQQPGESQPELGYLFEASDDELGLPPAFSENEVTHVVNETVGYDQIWRFEDEILSYHEFGISDESDNTSNKNEEFLALDGWFDYSDVYSGGQPDFSDFLYQPESLPAL